ncbi:MAG: four helix bundle protein [Bacteroidales bacterium]|nr:four helix bundle protein [Bacteroidales bacterium]
MNNKFEDLKVWKNSFDLTINIYKHLKECRDYGFKDQIQRAAVSILSNIAEGLERNHAKEIIQFLYIAKGSCGEVRAQLHIAKALGYISPEKADVYIDNSALISSQLYNLIQYRLNGKKSNT